MRRPTLITLLLILTVITPSARSAGNDKGDASNSPISTWWLPLGSGVIAALATFLLTSTTSQRLKRLEIELDYVERQLDDFYGPLLGECIQTDAMFLKTEEAIAHLFPESDHHHSHFAELLTLERKDDKVIYKKDASNFFAHLIEDVSSQSNRTKLELLKENVHLYGPHPPSSFAPFMSHASQVEAFLRICKSSECIPTDRASTVADRLVTTVPFPTLLTAEVFAKVAFLKCLQREYQYRISHSRAYFFLRYETEQVFHRDQYWLWMPASTRAVFARKPLAQCYKQMRLLWGPYTAVELIELRTWLLKMESQFPLLGWSRRASDIQAESPLKKQGADHELTYSEQIKSQLWDQAQYVQCMLQAKLMKEDETGDPIPVADWGSVDDHTVVSLAAKQSRASNGEQRQLFKQVIYGGDKSTLRYLPQNEDFAYCPSKFTAMNER